MATDPRDTGRSERGRDVAVARKVRAGTDIGAAKQKRAADDERQAAFEYVVRKHDDGLRRLAKR